jgi:hypothetical protein
MPNKYLLNEFLNKGHIRITINMFGLGNCVSFVHSLIEHQLCTRHYSMFQGTMCLRKQPHEADILMMELKNKITK